MIRVRFHGRGGQGMKTASRVLGTGALLDGFVAQDSPVYGAERRGAPMAAFTRISTTAIFERGVIPAPDLVVVADDTLLDDVAARPLAGLTPAGALLIASADAPEDTRRRTGHPGTLVVRDFLTLALAEVRHHAGLSSALAAAAAALLGLTVAAVDAALERELEAIGLGAAAIGANLRLAARARDGLARVTFSAARPAAAREPARLADVVYAGPEAGTPSIAAPANTPLRKTGNWRVFRPVIDLARCTRCWVCFARCPDGAIALDAADTPIIDYAVCKGCLICAAECPTHGIERIREARGAVTVETSA